MLLSSSKRDIFNGESWPSKDGLFLSLRFFRFNPKVFTVGAVTRRYQNRHGRPIVKRNNSYRLPYGHFAAAFFTHVFHVFTSSQ
jgi:hypothetical protein